MHWSSGLFSSSLDGCVHTTITAKSAVLFFPSGTWNGKQEMHMPGAFPALLCLDIIWAFPLLLHSYPWPPGAIQFPLVRSLWKLPFPLLTGSRKGRRLQANLCSESTGELLTKAARDRVCSGNIDKVRESMRRERGLVRPTSPPPPHTQQNTPSFLSTICRLRCQGVLCNGSPKQVFVCFGCVPHGELRRSHEFLTDKMVKY